MIVRRPNRSDARGSRAATTSPAPGLSVVRSSSKRLQPGRGPHRRRPAASPRRRATCRCGRQCRSWPPDDDRRARQRSNRDRPPTSAGRAADGVTLARDPAATSSRAARGSLFSHCEMRRPNRQGRARCAGPHGSGGSPGPPHEGPARRDRSRRAADPERLEVEEVAGMLLNRPAALGPVHADVCGHRARMALGAIRAFGRAVPGAPGPRPPAAEDEGAIEPAFHAPKW